jgi:hypothetical protein
MEIWLISFPQWLVFFGYQKVPSIKRGNMNRNKLFFSIFGMATLLIGCSKPGSNIATENAAKTAISDEAKEKMDATREKLKEAFDAWVSGVSYKQYEKDHYNVNFADSEYKGGKVLMRYEIGAFQITKKGYEVTVTKVLRSQAGTEIEKRVKYSILPASPPFNIWDIIVMAE